MLNTLIKIFRLCRNHLNNVSQKKYYLPIYRVIDIYKVNDDYYEVKIQIANKNSVFNMRPEEILADNNLVDSFSPRDIRTLTYLGYLEINAPKYKILAKRLSEEHDKFFFAIKEKGKKNLIVKTANEIQREKQILKNLESNDANIIGYTAASENISQEKEELKKILTKKRPTIGKSHERQ